MSSSTIDLGQDWAVPAGKPGKADAEPTVVTFAGPDGSQYAVHAGAEGGQLVAHLILNQPGRWTATAGDLEETVTVTDPDPVADESAGEFDPQQGGNIDDTLAWVGDDHDRAQQVLDLETVKGDDARSSLVDKLRALLDA